MVYEFKKALVSQRFFLAKQINDMWNFISNSSSIATLLGVGFSSLLKDSEIERFAFAAFLLALSFVTWRLFLAIKSWQKRLFPKGYIPIATFVRYRTTDGCQCIYEVFRYIQIKTAFKKSFDHNFYWTGSKNPTITSSLQDVGKIIGNDPTKTKKVTFTFKEHRFYNDTEVIHIEMQLDDSDKKSEPYISALVDYPMRLLQLRVELLHYRDNDFGKVAILERMDVSTSRSEHAEFVFLQQVPFSATTKSYDCSLPNPEPGFNYRLRWGDVSLLNRAG